MPTANRNLFVCYVPGLDRRRITREATPFLSGFLAENPTVSIRTLPSTELVPTLVTGTWPHENGIWQVSLRSDVPRGPLTRAAELVPDQLVTTYQCFRHLLGDFELAGIPWRRRRHFNTHRFKYPRRRRRELSGLGAESLFDWVGPNSVYRFCQLWEELPKLRESLPTAGHELEFLELYAFDITSHWNLDRPEVMRPYLGKIDSFVRELARRCETRGVTLVLLVDHGQEQIRRTVDLRKIVRNSGARRSEYHFFMEVGQARLWFETDAARRHVTQALDEVEGVNLVDWKDMARVHVGFPDTAFGELYAIAEQGVGFFPHDFYNPIANLYLGLTDRKQRPRVRDPRHRASHGMLPDHPAEVGYLAVADPEMTPDRGEIELIDFAPTVLDLLGREVPDHLAGRPAFRRNGHG